MLLSPYTIPHLKTFKNGKQKLQGIGKIKWFATPHRTIPVQKDGEYQNIKYEHFNPGSRAHIKLWMEHDLHYSFPYFTEAGNVKVDVDSLESMEHPSGQMLKRYLKVVKDQSQVGGDGGSLLNHYNPNTHCVHSRVDTNGTVTGRFTSSSPNLAQVPSQKEFRELFSAPEGWSFLGSDFDGQENVILSELLYPFDNGRLDKIITSGDKSKGTDLHSLNAKACNVTRQQSKPLWFGFLFGSSPTLTGYTLLGNDTYDDYTKKEFQAMRKKLIRRVVEVDGAQFYPIKKGTLIPFTDHVVEQAIFGKHTQDKLIQSTTGLKELIASLKTKAKQDGYLTMPGGRVVEVRHEHASLNSATQGGGGETMKVFLVKVFEALANEGLKFGTHFKLQATIYDETDYIVRNDCIDKATKAILSAYKTTSEYLGMTTTFTGEVLTGLTWQDCH